MGSEIETVRPNIRIQIQNTFSEGSEEKMDVDVEDDGNEEGEISDDNEKNHSKPDVEPSVTKKVITGIFTTGINIFDKREQEKLQERAKRFSLKPEEIHSFTDQDLQELYESLGINPTNENEVKFETVHLLGLDEMSAEDVVDYFAGYAPEGIEWIDENSCNLVWLDKLSAARGLHFKSRVVKDMPARQPKQIFPKEFLDDVEDPEESDQSILIKNKNREIELQNEIGEVILPKKKIYPKNAADISEITIPIPPGYWRLGNPHLKTKCLLMRYGLLSDKLPFKSEKCSKHYKKLANPGQKNVISESKKKELRSIFERNRELNQSKNPWGLLAKNWDRDAKFREREPVMHKLNADEDEPVVEIKNPKLMARLGTKRKLNTESEKQKPENKEENDDDLIWESEKKKPKIPRMKMYADEEEENMKRKKLLQTIKKQAENIDKKGSERDLRDMLGPTSRLVTKQDVPQPEHTIDLGSKLRNRNQKMIFAIERDLFDRETPQEEYVTRDVPDVRTELIERSRLRHSERKRDRSPLVSRSVLLRQRERRPSPERRRRSSERYRRSSRRRSPERTLHSDRIHSRSILRRRSYSPSNRYGHKPRSKVSVVIKTPKKPTVASTIWSKVRKSSESEQSSSESESEESENSSSSSDSESESEESDEDQSDSSSGSSRKHSRNPDRPGFDKSRLTQKINHKSPLKITMANEHYRRNRK